eukprot:COSAG01_NODE_5294_length_4352_cov_12.531860_2_plen_946_part_00
MVAVEQLNAHLDGCLAIGSEGGGASSPVVAAAAGCRSSRLPLSGGAAGAGVRRTVRALRKTERYGDLAAASAMASEEEEEEEEQEEEPEYVIECLRSLRRSRCNHDQLEFLVKWEGYSERESTWEPESEMLRAVPLLVRQLARWAMGPDSDCDDPTKASLAARGWASSGLGGQAHDESQEIEGDEEESSAVAARAADDGRRQQQRDRGTTPKRQCIRIHRPPVTPPPSTHTQRGGQSRYRGVSWGKNSGQWRVSIKHKGSQEHLGFFSDGESAARVYDERARELHGVAARLNFPRAGERQGVAWQRTDPEARDAQVKAANEIVVAERQKQHQSSSRYRGVSWCNFVGKWVAALRHQGHRQHIGVFVDEESAARAYDVRARELRGVAAWLNFPRAGERQGVTCQRVDPEVRAAGAALVATRRQQDQRSSKYRGVSWVQGKWSARISQEGRKQHLGAFPDEESAARAYDARAHELHGVAAQLNFPRAGERQGAACQRVDRVARAASAALVTTRRQQQGQRSSKYRGVSWDKNSGRWRVCIKHKGGQEHLGSLLDEESAARAYDERARELHGVAARLNFPRASEQQGAANVSQDAHVKAAYEALVATRRQQHANSSKYRGVTWKKKLGKWSAAIGHEQRWQHLGYFLDEESAARAYDARARELRGVAARLNLRVGEQSLDPEASAVSAASEALVATRRQQHASSSKYRGVTWRKRLGKWLAAIRHEKSVQHLGCFLDEESAARAYDARARELHGVAARLNFPRAGERQGAACQRVDPEVRAAGAALVATRRQQGQRSSKYRGVSWEKQLRMPWRVSIKHKGGQEHLGSFLDEESAARAYDARARELHGVAARLNFPRMGERQGVARQCGAGRSSAPNGSGSRYNRSESEGSSESEGEDDLVDQKASAATAYGTERMLTSTFGECGPFTIYLPAAPCCAVAVCTLCCAV